MIINKLQKDRMIRKNFNGRGFTVIELIISIGLFSIILVAITGSLLSVIKINKQASLIKDVMNNLDFALENMVRSVRTGRNYDCGLEGGEKNCSVTPSTMISFQPQGIFLPRVYYKLENKIIMRKDGTGTYYPVTSSNVKITRLNFYVSGVDSPDVQPTVLFVIGGEASYKENTTTFNVETLAVQRLFNK